MKKLFLVLAVVAVYAFSITAASASVVISEKAEISIVADDNITPDTEKDKTTAKKAETKAAETKGAACGAEAKAETKACCSAAQKTETAAKAPEKK